MTRGPGPKSFTKALSWALKKLAKNDEGFSTAELRHKTLEHKTFPDDQSPVLAYRCLPDEYFVISREEFGPQSANLIPSKTQRLKGLQSNEHIDLRFHFDGVISLDHFFETAGALRSLVESGNAHWTRVTFLGKSSLVDRVITKWSALARETATYPRSPMSSRRDLVNEDSISFHVSAITRALWALASFAIEWFINKVSGALLGFSSISMLISGSSPRVQNICLTIASKGDNARHSNGTCHCPGFRSVYRDYGNYRE